jgi:hypothetical protein
VEKLHIFAFWSFVSLRLISYCWACTARSDFWSIFNRQIWFLSHWGMLSSILTGSSPLGESFVNLNSLTPFPLELSSTRVCRVCRLRHNWCLSVDTLLRYAGKRVPREPQQGDFGHRGVTASLMNRLPTRPRKHNFEAGGLNWCIRYKKSAGAFGLYSSCRDEKAAISPYWGDKTPEAIAMICGAYHHDYRPAIICTKSGFDR